MLLLPVLTVALAEVGRAVQLTPFGYATVAI